MTGMSVSDYEQMIRRTRARRMKWWREARFGMFIHWGLYSQLGRNEWVMNLERIPVREYERLAWTWRPKPRAAREWARLAREAGMKYMVMTTKHHEGFLLWDSKMTDYNAVQRGPGRDLVREYVEACREFGLRVGFYYSLMDWHHPDGARCAFDQKARERFLAFTKGCVRELMANYGRIDILWYDVAWPLRSAEEWDSLAMNRMARELQPDIIINNRSLLPEDFGTPEEHVTAAERGRDWEACMTFNGSWGWQEAPPEDWRGVRQILEMLRTCCSGQGNLLLNIGPLPDGSVPKLAAERLRAVGRWLKTYGGVVYGKVDRTDKIVSALGNFSRKGRKYFFWCSRWPGRELAIGALTGRMEKARLYPNGPDLPFTQVRDRLVVSGLPEECPDKIAGVGIIEMTFRSPPRQVFSAGCVTIPSPAPRFSGKWLSPAVDEWRVSRLMMKKNGIEKAPAVSLSEPLGWSVVSAGDPQHFINVHSLYGDTDGLVYLANKFKTPRSGSWTLCVGHDGGIRVFVDRKPAFCEPQLKNPAVPGRSMFDVKFQRGTHEVVIALDTCKGMGWGIFFNWGIPEVERKKKKLFPQLAK